MEKQTKLQFLIASLCICALLIMLAIVLSDYYCGQTKDKVVPLSYNVLAFVGSIFFLAVAGIIWRAIGKIHILVKIFFWITVLLVTAPISIFLFFMFVVMNMKP